MGLTAVRERPILFSALMVRAILDGRKTQTRRVITPDPSVLGHWKNWTEDRTDHWLRMSPWQAGGKLWVRETFFDGGKDFTYAQFAADGIIFSRDWKKRPSIHMPRRLSRITLEITEVRVQRLQEITEADSRAEGFPRRGAFALAWDEMNPAERSFVRNPYVWAITFKEVSLGGQK